MDEMPEVTQRFVADVEEYVHEVKRAADEATSFAGHVERVNIALNGMTDKLTTAAVALGITRDEMGRLRDKAGEVITATEAEARALKHLRDQALEAAWAERELGKYQEQRGGLLSRLSGLFGGSGGGGGLGGLLAKGGEVGGIPGGAYGIAGAAGAVVSALPVLGMLLTGLTAASAGLVSFGAVAKSNYSAAATAANQVQAAQIAYNAEVAHGVKHATAYRTEQIAIAKAYAQLSPAQIQLSQEIGNVQNAWQSFVQSNTGGVSKVLTQGIGLLPGIFKVMQQFIGPTEQALSGIITMIGQGMASPGFKQFTSFLASLAGPVLTTIGQGIIGLLPQLAQLMELFSKKDVVSAFKDTFRLLGLALWLVTEAIKQTMIAFDQLTKALHLIAHYFDVTRHAVADFAHNVAAHFDEIRHDVATWAHDVAHWFDEVRHWVAGLAHDIAVWFDRIRHDIAHWVDNVVQFFKDLPHRVLSALGNLGKLLLQAGKDVVNGLLNGIKDAAGGLLNFVGGLGHSISSTFSSVLHILSPSRVFYEHGRNTLLGYIQGLQAVAPQVRAVLAAVGGQVAAGGLPGITGGGAYSAIGPAGSGRVNVNVPVTINGVADARFMQGLQSQIQEAILRYAMNNSSSGLFLPGRMQL